MGRKGSWFSTIKRVFTPNSKEKPVDGSDKKSTKEKKKRGILRHGESKSFIPLFREPSSIEQILGEMDQQQLLIRPSTPVEQPTLPPLVVPRAASRRVASPRAASPQVTSPKAASLRVGSPRAASSRALQHHREISYRPEPTLRYRNVSATKIQAAYRGYMARRGFKALRGLVRLQGVVRGQNVERQTMNAMKMMQLLVRVQTQIQSRRIQMLENQALQRQAYNNDKELESTLGKWTANQSEAGLNEEWDDSVLTKEEIEARLQRKAEALMKRERVMAYSYSHQLWKANPKSAQISPMDPRSGGFPWWWNWLDRQLPPPANPPESQTMKSFLVTPPRPKPSPTPSPFNYKQPNIEASPFNYKQPNIGVSNLELLTPRSTRSATPMRTRYQYTPSNRKYSKPRTSDAGSAFDMKDDDSLMSCPPFSVPNYMTPTASAKAKARESGSTLKDRFSGTPGADSNSKKRFSFMLTSNFASFKWNKGSSKDSNSQRVIEKQKSLHSVGDVSIDSAVSMPAAFGRKPFNRNLVNLEELIVEDCPKIDSLVSLKSSDSKSGPFLPNLKKISLLELPELVSISSGLCVAPNLERMVIFYCPKLEKLSTMDVSSTKLKVIKGEKEWWDALKWYESDLSTEHEDYLGHLFIPLRRDGDMMAQLTKD